MAEVSRTARVIQNAKVALFFYCINLILQFFSRKIFLDCLGSELLGLNTTAQNLLQFLNLAESGIGAAIAFALYKPLSKGNREEIVEIVSLQGWFYRWVGFFVIAGSLILMFFFPWIFAKAQVPLIYTYGTFTAFLISALLGYFVNYKIVVLSADQKDFKITSRTQTTKSVKVLCQMYAVLTFEHGYVWWMLIEAITAVVSAMILNQCVKQEYSWLKTDVSRGRLLRKKYAFILRKIKQLFFHKIGGFVLGQTTPLVIFAFSNLTIVAIYGNYLVIMGGCLALVEAFSRGFYAGVGNLVSEGNEKSIMQTFWKIITFKLFLAGMIVSGILIMSESFICLWVGHEYVMSTLPLIIMTASLFIQMTRTSDMFLSAYGLFQDIWAPVVESLLNLGLSVFLGFLWGLEGILMGVLLSQIIIVNTWKVYFLYKEAFKNSSFSEYILSYTKKMMIVLISLVSTKYIAYHFISFEINNYFDWITTATLVTLLYLLIGGFLFFAFDLTFRKNSVEILSRC